MFWVIKQHFETKKRMRQSMRGIYKDYTWLACLIMVLVVLAAMAVVTLALAERTMYCTANDYLRCRMKPDTSSEMLYKLYPGDTVVVTEISGSWATLYLYGDECYAHINFLSDTPPCELPERMVVRNGRLYMRSSPGGGKVGWLESGTVVNLRGMIRNWCFVEAKGRMGWVDRTYLEEL